MMNIEQIAADIVDSAIKVHKNLGPGLLESVYQHCLAFELRKRGHQVSCEIILPIEYDGLHLDAGYRIDMFVDNCIIIENKTVDQLLPIHEAQILTYLKLQKVNLGFLFNWNTKLLKHGIRRIVNNYVMDHEINKKVQENKQ